MKNQDHKASMAKLVFQSGLYVRMCFGLILIFGVVGNCSGHRDAGVGVVVLTCVVWTFLRILLEAFESWHLLNTMKRLEAEARSKPPESKKDDDDTNLPPPSAVA